MVTRYSLTVKCYGRALRETLCESLSFFMFIQGDGFVKGLFLGKDAVNSALVLPTAEHLVLYSVQSAFFLIHQQKTLLPLETTFRGNWLCA